MFSWCFTSKNAEIQLQNLKALGELRVAYYSKCRWFQTGFTFRFIFILFFFVHFITVTHKSAIRCQQPAALHHVSTYESPDAFVCRDVWELQNLPHPPVILWLNEDWYRLLKKVETINNYLLFYGFFMSFFRTHFFFINETFFFKVISTFLVACYATLHPALSVGPSIGPSVTLYFLGVNGGFGLIAPAQMFHWPQLWPLPTRTRLG